MKLQYWTVFLLHVFMYCFVVQGYPSIRTEPKTHSKCPVDCICGKSDELLKPRSVKVNNVSQTITKTGWDTIELAQEILRSYRRRFDVIPTGSAVVCPRSNFTTLSRMKKEAGDLLNNISVLSVRCGLLKSIRSGDFQSFRQQIRIIDFSNNRIRHIAQDSLQGLVGLRILLLDSNLLKKIVLSPGTPGQDITIPKQRQTLISLVENPITCTCQLIRIISLQFRLTNDDETFCLSNTSSTDENLERNENRTRKNDTGVSSISLSFLLHQSDLLLQSCRKSESFLGEFLESQKGKLPGSIETESTNPEYLEPKPCRLQKSVPKNTFRYINEEERKYRNRTVETTTERPIAIDYPLLVTMAAWFMMVFVGLWKFIRSNTLDYEMHKTYLKKLDEQENPAVSPITVINDVQMNPTPKPFLENNRNNEIKIQCCQTD